MSITISAGRLSLSAAHREPYHRTAHQKGRARSLQLRGHFLNSLLRAKLETGPDPWNGHRSSQLAHFRAKVRDMVAGCIIPLGDSRRVGRTLEFELGESIGGMARST